MADVRHWRSMTSTEAARLADQDPVVILPVAAIEQHGPHLPLSTDLDIGIGLLENAVGRLPDDIPAWLLPAQAIGSSRYRDEVQPPVDDIRYQRLLVQVREERRLRAAQREARPQ